MSEEGDALASRICLKVLAPQTLEVMRELETSTSDDLANIVIDNLIKANPKFTGEETVRRRVYDIINVLSAAGFIDKAGKRLVYRGDECPHVPKLICTRNAEQEARCRYKEKVLRDRLSILTLYKALLARNFGRGEPPPDSFPLPAVLLCLKEPDEAAVIQPINGPDLEIRGSSRNLTFMGQQEILQRLKLSKDFIRTLICKASGELAECRTTLSSGNDSVE